MVFFLRNHIKYKDFYQKEYEEHFPKESSLFNSYFVCYGLKSAVYGKILTRTWWSFQWRRLNIVVATPALVYTCFCPTESPSGTTLVQCIRKDRRGRSLQVNLVVKGSRSDFRPSVRQSLEGAGVVARRWTNIDYNWVQGREMVTVET